jgi:DNA-binding transcriptional regulator YhcF (GntR family)
MPLRLTIAITQTHHSGTNLVDSVPTHQELAIMINTGRTTVTRALQIMTQHQIIMRKGNQLKVLQLGYLKDIADGRKESTKTSA